MKKLILIFFSSVGCFISNAQSEMIKKVFKLLPDSKVYNLTVATRDSMLDGKTYYPLDNDSNEIIAYNYGSSVYVKDYLYISLSFETDQRATGMIEIRSFKMTNGDNMIIVSQTSGISGIAHNQENLSIFIYGKDKKLVPYQRKIMPSTDESKFTKQVIPDTVKKKVLTNSNTTFDLSNEKLILSINSQDISRDEKLRKWLRGDRIYYDWIKDHFVFNKIEFQ
jgi:hypothetical protein